MAILASHMQIIAVAQFFLISLFLSFSWLKHKRSPAIGFLAIFFFAKTLGMLDFTLSMSFRRWVLHEAPLLDVILLPFLYLYIPAYYLFVRASCNSKFALSKKDIVHLAPALGLLVFIVFRYLSIDDSVIFRTLARNQFFSAWEKWAIFRTRHPIVILYLVACLFEIKRYHAELRWHFSDERVRQLRWLTWLTLALCVISVWYFLRSIVAIFIPPSPELGKIAHIVSVVLLFLFANGVVYKSLSHFPFAPSAKPRANTQVRSPSSERRDWDRLMHCMEQEHAYLQQGLKLEQLADMLNFSPRYVTELIQKYTDSNFYSFVNRFRVEEAKKRLVADASNQIIEILYDSGFSSKSTFNEVFKQAEGQTPTQYRRQHLSSSKSPETASG